VGAYIMLFATLWYSVIAIDAVTFHVLASQLVS
jgi:hypothetical protein